MRAEFTICLLLIGAPHAFSTSAAEEPKPTGWRNDGSGVYPDATPPISWERVGTVMKGLRCQSARPKDEGEGGTSISKGVITDWLVLGPLDVKDPKDPKQALEEEILPKEADAQPDTGEQAAGAAWKAFKTENHFADFEAVFGKDVQQKVVYAHTYIYAPVAGTLTFRPRLNYIGSKSLTAKFWLNGKPVIQRDYKFTVKKGWNSLLAKIFRNECTSQFYLKMDLHSTESAEYENRNIAWSLPLPFSASPPIVVGDKLFICYEPHFLACFDKTNGKVLWVRSNGYHDAAEASERLSHPEIKDADALAAKVEAIDAELLKSPPSTKAPAEREEHLKAMKDLMLKVDPVKYKPNPEQVGNAGYAGMSPCSDGKFVYAWFGTGVTACYDLEGKRQWIRVDNAGWQHHGYGCSPILVDGNVIVYMRGLYAFDCKTGQMAWQKTWNMGPMCMYGTWAKVMVGNVTTLVPPTGNCAVLASNGELIHGIYPNAGCLIASPVVDENIVYTLPQFGPLGRLEISAGGPKGATAKNLGPLDISPPQFPFLHMGKHDYAASPVCHNGLLYCVDSEGDLIVVDLKKGAVVYQRKLDINALFWSTGSLHVAGVSASLAIAGKYLYVQGNTGDTLVLELGPEYKLVAKNKIEETSMVAAWDERQESFIINPVFDGKRMYLRGEKNLYCICEK